MASPTAPEHPFRQSILHELHARAIEPVPERSRVRRLVFVASPESSEVSEALARLRTWCVDEGVPAPSEQGRQHTFEVRSLRVTWEFHTEFISVTWTAPLDDADNLPEGIGLETLTESRLIGATRIDVIDDDRIPERLIPGFRSNSLCLVDVEGGRAQLVTDFVADDALFIRFEFAAGRLNPLRRAIVVRRLLEIETYRTMALLGLPLARQHAPALRNLELELSAGMGSLSDATTTDTAQAALARLHDLSVRSGQLSERLSYRFAASQAYGDIVLTRLASLDESPTGNGSTLSRYIGNRVDPALHTLEAMEKRLDVLSGKIERAVELLNVRIGLDLQLQNKEVLETIAETAQSQFRLQRTVEGLSTIAISYYVLAVIGYAFAEPFHLFNVSKTLVLSILAPVVLLGVWLMVRSVRKKHF